MQWTIHADPALPAANLVSSLRIQPSLFARPVSQQATRSTRSIREFAAKIANQISTSTHKDGNAKSVHRANMSLKIREDVGCAPNIALAAIRILLLRNWNVLSAILGQPLIRIQSAVFLLASQASFNIT